MTLHDRPACFLKHSLFNVLNPCVKAFLIISTDQGQYLSLHKAIQSKSDFLVVVRLLSFKQNSSRTLLH